MQSSLQSVANEQLMKTHLYVLFTENQQCSANVKWPIYSILTSCCSHWRLESRSCVFRKPVWSHDLLFVSSGLVTGLLHSWHCDLSQKEEHSVTNDIHSMSVLIQVLQEAMTV